MKTDHSYVLFVTAIRYILPVWCMTSWFPLNGPLTCMARGLGNIKEGAVQRRVVRFPTHSPEGATLFDTVDGRQLRTWRREEASRDYIYNSLIVMILIAALTTPLPTRYSVADIRRPIGTSSSHKTVTSASRSTR